MENVKTRLRNLPIGRNMVFIAAAIIVIVLIIITLHDPPGETYLTGAWIASEDFCAKSDIDSMMIVIGPPEGMFWKTRRCYVTITPDLSNQEFEMKYSKSPLSSLSYHITPTLIFEEEQIIPENATIHVDILRGILTITAEGTVYGEFYKSLDVSDLIVNLGDDVGGDGATDKPQETTN